MTSSGLHKTSSIFVKNVFSVVWNSAFTKITYIRILGFNTKGQKYLNSIKKDLTLPLISKITKEKDPMLTFELETTKIYALNLEANKQEELIKREYQQIIKGD